MILSAFCHLGSVSETAGYLAVAAKDENWETRLVVLPLLYFFAKDQNALTETERRNHVLVPLLVLSGDPFPAVSQKAQDLVRGLLQTSCPHRLVHDFLSLIFQLSMLSFPKKETERVLKALIGENSPENNGKILSRNSQQEQSLQWENFLATELPNVQSALRNSGFDQVSESILTLYGRLLSRDAVDQALLKLLADAESPHKVFTILRCSFFSSLLSINRCLFNLLNSSKILHNSATL